jgi:hypothetical protein
VFACVIAAGCAHSGPPACDSFVVESQGIRRFRVTVNVKAHDQPAWKMGDGGMPDVAASFSKEDQSRASGLFQKLAIERCQRQLFWPRLRGDLEPRGNAVRVSATVCAEDSAGAASKMAPAIRIWGDAFRCEYVEPGIPE